MRPGPCWDGLTALQKHIIARLQRARAAHANGFETIPMFAIALLAARQAKVPVETLNSTATAFVISRFVYVLLCALRFGTQLIVQLPVLDGSGHRGH